MCVKICGSKFTFIMFCPKFFYFSGFPVRFLRQGSFKSSSLDDNTIISGVSGLSGFVFVLGFESFVLGFGLFPSSLITFFFFSQNCNVLILKY